MKAKTKFTKLWSILLALAMVVGMLPIAALAAGSATATADFSTDPTAALSLLNAAKTGTTDITWDGDTSTLTLGGVNFVTSAATAVKLPDGAKIVLNGENTIKGGSGSGDCYGIYGVGSLTISGIGTLNVTSGTAGNLSFGIHAQNSVTINSGAVTATGGAAPNNQSFGIRALYNDLTINGGTVTATGVDAKYSSNGLWAGNGSVVIRGGEVEAESGRVMGVGASSGIYAKNVEINNTGTIVTATGGTAQHGTSYGINAVSGGTVTFSGGTLTAATKGDSCINGTFNAAGKTISFDSNDGVGNMMARTTATEYTLPANGFTPPAGKQLKGWATSANGEVISGTTIDVSADVSADTKLFAIWEDIKYTVTFDVNGANAAVAPASGTTNAAGKLTSLPEPTRSGYTFKEWNTKQDGSGTTVTDETTFTENTTVYAQWEVSTVSIPSVAITGIDAPKSNTALDTEADCNTTGVSNAKPTVTWDSSDSKAGYGKIYTASITLTASEGYKFADSATATVNGNPATSVTKNANGTLKVTYAFPATDKHNIEITVDTDVRDGDAAKNPTISSGYEIEYCFFVEDTDKDGVFINKTGDSITFDDKTLVVDKALVEAFAAQSEGRFTYESLMAVLKDEFDLDELKTEFTGGYDYSVLAYICHSDNAYFDNDDNQIVTNAIVKVNGKKITDNCLGFGSGMDIIPGAYVFSAAKTYTVSFDANGGKGTMANATGISGEYTLPENGFTAPEGKQFKCWSVGSTEKAVGDKIAVSADTTVKAVWENIPAAPIEYEILDGANSSWTHDSDGSLSIRGNGAFSEFVGVKVDGKSVDEKYYTVKEGSTIVTLKAGYLNTLTVGSHTLEIIWTDGSASTAFTVSAQTVVESPQTGDNSMMALWIAVLFVSGIGVMGTTIYIRKKKYSVK